MGIKATSYRFDDDVRGQIAELRKVYGTDNAVMRFVFGLSGTAKVVRVEKVEGQVPKVVLKKMPPDLSVESVVTKMNVKEIEYTRGRSFRGPLLKPSERKK